MSSEGPVAADPVRDRAIDALLDKQAIYEVLCRYCHGIDRCDVDMLKSAYWPDAFERHGTFDGNAHEFAETITASMRRDMLRSMQKIGNVLVDLAEDGGSARSETYVVGYMQVEDGGGVTDMVVAGRYLDRLEKRAGEWRIKERLYVMDWNRNDPSSARWDEGIYAMLSTRGGRAPDDPYYRLLEA